MLRKAGLADGVDFVAAAGAEVAVTVAVIVEVTGIFAKGGIGGRSGMEGETGGRDGFSGSPERTEKVLAEASGFAGTGTGDSGSEAAGAGAEATGAGIGASGSEAAGIETGASDSEVTGMETRASAFKATGAGAPSFEMAGVSAFWDSSAGAGLWVAGFAEKTLAKAALVRILSGPFFAEEGSEAGFGAAADSVRIVIFPSCVVSCVAIYFQPEKLVKFLRLVLLSSAWMHFRMVIRSI